MTKTHEKPVMTANEAVNHRVSTGIRGMRAAWGKQAALFSGGGGNAVPEGRCRR